MEGTFTALPSFNPRTPCGVRPFDECNLTLYFKFQSTHSLRSATWNICRNRYSGKVSIHALLAECDRKKRRMPFGENSFNPRTPCGVRLHAGCEQCRWETFQSTHSLRSATVQPYRGAGRRLVSIHALLAECDGRSGAEKEGRAGFNPRTPCGVRPLVAADYQQHDEFQSTHSLRSATLGKDAFIAPTKTFQSTHSLRSATGGRPEKWRFRKFQSTHSLRSATGLNGLLIRREEVSIHALLAECDHFRRGIRLHPVSFQSTHSLRSATAPDLIHCYSTEQIILCANLPKKTVIARLLFLSIYLSIFYSQCITPIADLPGNSCELEVGAQAMFNSL